MKTITEERLAKILVTGACGFIGTNVCLYYLDKGVKVYGLDNLSRKGSTKNRDILLGRKGFTFIQADVSHRLNINFEVDAIFHLAGQVGVQASIANPSQDMYDNIVGTHNVLEYARAHQTKPFVLFSSTNKVYGDIQVDKPVSEDQQLNFHTPYGVSKGSADQYVLDYSRIYGIPTVVFRQSCIYGPYQHGAEEQGWVAWFLIANRDRLPITIFGDGTQVRDVLYIDDLVSLYDMAWDNKEIVNGQAYNVGGGDKNVISLLDLIKEAKIDTEISYADWRPADQKYYVSDITKITRALGWKPKITAKKGIKLLNDWLHAKN